MYYFNIPPSWPLPSDFVPPEGWAPHPSFQPVPNNWEFWVLEDYDPEVPTANFEDRGMFNTHPLEVAARKAEVNFIEAKNFVNLAINKARSERNRKEQTSGFSRFDKLREEEYVEECIPPLVHLGINASQARQAANQEFTRLKNVQENYNAVEPSVIPVELPKIQTHTLPPSTPISPPAVPKISAAPKYKNQAIQPLDIATTHVDDSKKLSQSISIVKGSEPNNNLHLEHEGVTPVPPAQESLRTNSDSFWNSFIQKVNKLSLFTLLRGKKELIQALNEAKQDIEVYESIRHGRKWAEVQEHLHLVETEIIAKRQKADDEIAKKLEQNNDYIASLLISANKELESLKQESQRLAQINSQESERIILNNVSYHDYYHPATTSIKLSGELKEIQKRAKEMCKNKTATFASNNFAFNNSQAQGRKFVNDLCTLMLTAYNQEAENVITKATGAGRDLQRALERLEKANIKIRRMGRMIEMEINPQYHTLRLREIELAFAYKEQQELEKEMERENKARLREEARVLKEAQDKLVELERQEREAQRQVQLKLEEMENQRITKLQYEEDHYANALKNAEDIKKLNENEQIIAELRAKLEEIRLAKERNSETIANSRAGYVYVISNVGALGEGIVKIGLTRRLDPLDRVKELSSASVPFPYDIHAIHFSADAVQLETALHQYFSSKKVNLINKRKEFFYVTPQEVRDAMQKFSNGALMQFNVDVDAVQWRQSMQERNSNQ